MKIELEKYMTHITVLEKDVKIGTPKNNQILNTKKQVTVNAIF